MNQPLTVYVLPECVNCAATTGVLDAAGVPYRLVELVRDEKAVEYVQQLGYTEAPIVTVGAAHWSGHQPDKLRAVTAARAGDLYTVPTDPMEALQCDSCQ